MILKFRGMGKPTSLNKAAATRAIFTYDFLLSKDVKEYIT